MSLLVHDVEEIWFPFPTLTTDLCKSVSAGISHVFAQLIKLFFGSLGTDVQASGMSLLAPDGSRHRIFVSMGMILQDGGPHKNISHIKGDDGTKL